MTLCWLLYRRAVRLNVGVFFSRTALALIVIAAGVLSAGLGDLQDAGLLPGQHWVLFDLNLDPNSWRVSLLTGITDLTPRITVLQAVAWVTYLVVVIPMFIRAGRAAPAPAPTPAPSGSAGARWERLAGQRTWAVAGVLVAVPAVAAGSVIAALPAASAATTTTVTVTGSGCARDWTSARAGTQTLTVTNSSSRAGEITLDNAAGGIVAEIETLGPATTAPMTATLGGGSYTFQCRMSGQAAMSSAAVNITGQVTGPGAGPAAVKPVTLQELTGPNRAYRAYAAGQLAALAGAVTMIQVLLATEAGGRRQPPDAVLARQRVDAALGAVLETLAQVPDLLEVPPTA